MLAGTLTAAAAQTPRSTGRSGAAATRAASSNADSPSGTATTVAPNYFTGNGQRTGRQTNTAPATGATRASRSSSGPKTRGQSRPTGNGNIASLSKSGSAKPGTKE